jgi:hypothetical protein
MNITCVQKKNVVKRFLFSIKYGVASLVVKYFVKQEVKNERLAVDDEIRIKRKLLVFELFQF